MGVLDQVMQLKGQGMSDAEITDNLQQQGVSPKDITDAMNQAQIKNAVAAENPGEAAPTPGVPPAELPSGPGGAYSPQTQDIGAAEAGAYPQGELAQAAPAEYYEEGAYPAEAGAPSTGVTDSDTIIEIANQVFSEKIKKMQKQVDDIVELKTVVQVKVDSIDTRLKRIEKIIDTLQIKVLEKVGSFGREIATTKKEVAMVEDSLGKIVKGRTASKPIKKVVRKTPSRKRK